MKRPHIRPGPASQYAGPMELIREFGDDKSGGLISIMRTADGKLTVDIYRQDADVVVRVGTPDHPPAVGVPE